MRASPFLLIDAGNTRCKWATAAHRGAVRPAGEMATTEVSVPSLQALARKHPDQQVMVSCVVPKLLPLLRRAFGPRLNLVTGRSPALGLTFDYPKPEELGADRLASAVAAQAEAEGAIIVINCGTATAFSVLDHNGRFCGGVIAPGLETQLHSLVARGAQLPAITLKAPRRALARSTAEAIRAGVMLNFHGGVNEIVRQLSAALPGPAPRILITGGTARHLVNKLELPATLRPLLVFEGLRIMAVRLFFSRP